MDNFNQTIKVLTEKKVPRLISSNPRLLAEIKASFKPFMKTVRFYAQQDLIQHKKYKTDISFTVFDPYKRKKITVPLVFRAANKNEEKTVAYAHFIQAGDYIEILMPNVMDDLINHPSAELQQTRYFRLMVHELSHIVDPSVGHSDRSKVYLSAEEEYYATPTEINSFTQELLLVLDQAIEDGIVTKRYALDRLRGPDKVFIKFIDAMVKQSNDTILPAVQQWKHHDELYKSKLMRELRSRLYNSLQSRD